MKLSSFLRLLLQVQAPGLPDLTLIDLPGIVRTATKGQRASVMSEVNGLIQRYVLNHHILRGSNVSLYEEPVGAEAQGMACLPPLLVCAMFLKQKVNHIAGISTA